MSIVYRDKEGNLKKEDIPFDDLPYEEKAAWYAPICSDKEISGQAEFPVHMLKSGD